MAEPPQIALVPMMIFDRNGHYQTVFAPQALASLTVPPGPAASMMPLGAPTVQAVQTFLPQNQGLAPELLPKEAPRAGQGSPKKDGLAKFKAGCKIYISNLPAGMKDVEFKTLFSGFGPIVKATLVKRRRTTTFGFIQFANKDAAQAAITEKNSSVFEGRTLCVQFADGDKDCVASSKTVRVSNLPHVATKAEVEAIFSRFGTISVCQVEKVRGRPVTAIIEFSNVDEALAAQDTLHCFCIPGQDAVLEVEFLKDGTQLPPPPHPRDAAEPGRTSPAPQQPRGTNQEAQDSPDPLLCESPTSHLFMRVPGELAQPGLEMGMDDLDESDAAMLPLAEYIERMMQHYQMEPCMEDQHHDGTPSSGSDVSGTSNASWERSSGFTNGCSDNSHSDTSTTSLQSAPATAGLPARLPEEADLHWPDQQGKHPAFPPIVHGANPAKT